VDRLRRWLRWCAGLAVAVTVGWGVFAYVRQQPRCKIPASGILHLCDDGSRLVTAEHGQVQVWDTRHGTLLHSFLEPADDRWIELLPDKQHVLIAADDKLTLLDWQDGTVHALPVPGRPGEEYLIRFAHGGKWLAVIRKSHCTFIDVDCGQVVRQGDYAFHEFCGDDGLAVLGDGTMVGVATAPVLLDVRTGMQQKPWPLGPAGLAHSPDGKQLAVCVPKAPLVNKEHRDLSLADAELIVEVWDHARRRVVFHHETGPNTSLAGLEFTPDGRYLAVSLHDDDRGRLTLFELTSGQPRFTAPIAASSLFELAFQTDPATGNLLCLINEQPLGSNPPPEKVSMWNVATGERLWVRQALRHVRSLPDCSKVAALAEDDQVMFLDARTGTTAVQKFHAERYSVVDGGFVLLRGTVKPPDAPNVLWEWLAEHWPALFGRPHEFVSVIETRTGRHVFHLERGLEPRQEAPWQDRANTYRMELSSDGGTLVILPIQAPVLVLGVAEEPPVVIRCFDVYPQRAWAWAIGSAAGTGLGLVLLGAGWRRWRARRSAASTTGRG
jgi:WD40 repeat protein